jgi:acetylornithine deacetylase/succinyl-diaminopimelate desuccinylase-like protein
MNAIDPAIAALCRSLIAIPSVTGEGTRRIAEFCALEILAPSGIEARLVASLTEGSEQVNLLAFVAGRNPEARPLLLNTHLDTVPPGDAAMWTECGGNPFQASINGDRIYGLGAADTKLDFLAKAFALSQCGQPNRGVWLVGTFGEEHGLVGAKDLAAGNTIPRGAIAMVGEPSHLTVITAHKGLMAFELTIQFNPIRTEHEFDTSRILFSGKAAHSSTPALGENAIAKALSAIDLLSKTPLVSIDGGDAVNKVPARCEVVVASDRGRKNADAAIQTLRSARAIPSGAIQCLVRFANGLSEFTNTAGPVEADYAAPTLTSNLGVVHTRDDAIVLNFELRPPPSLALEVVRDGVSEIVEMLASGSPDLKLNLSEKRANRGFRSSDGSEAVELAMAALARASLPLDTGVKTGCTEAGVYAAVGLDPIVFGPGPSTGVIHAPNEYNFLSEVESAIRFYRALLE